MEKDLEYLKRKYKKTFYKLGYNMAAGKKGKWIAFSPTNLYFFNMRKNKNEEKAAFEYADNLTQQNLVIDKVGDKIIEVGNKEGLNDDVALDKLFIPLMNEWVLGYSDYILKVMKEKKKVKV
ncbi:MAG: hypothetical protein ACP5RX_03035 [Minisyncoccia bacterium]